MPRVLPLTDLRVLEMGTSVAAPYAGKVLAEMGADVLKVEHPDGGDTARRWGPVGRGGFSATFETFNRGKRSITIDLADPAAAAALRKIIEGEVDVVLQNLRPGAADRFGLGAQALVARCPRLVYCNMGAFGGAGPLSRQPGYDPLMQAISGISSLTGAGDGPPARVGVPIVDIGTALWAVIGILGLLERRRATGRGGVVDSSLFETAIAWLTLQISDYQATGTLPVRAGLRGPLFAPNDGFETADGILVIVCGTEAQFRRLCEVVGLPALTRDPRFANGAARLTHHEALEERLTGALRAHPRAWWGERLDRAGVPNAPLLALDEMLAHPHTAESGIIQRGPDGGFAVAGLPLRFDGERPPYTRGAPGLGEHNREVFGPAPQTAGAPGREPDPHSG